MRTKSSWLGSRALGIMGVGGLVAMSAYLAFREAQPPASRQALAQTMNDPRMVQGANPLPGNESVGRGRPAGFPPVRAAAGGPASGPTVSVKEFGAKGDGRSDDYEALKTAAAFICSHPGQTLLFPAGVYRIAPFRITGGPNANKITNISYDGCRDVTISGVGAKIDVFGGFKRAADYAGGGGRFHYSYSNAVIPFDIRNSSNFTLTGFEVNGNADKATRDKEVMESANDGISTDNCSNYTISNVNVHHFLTDGIYIGAGSKHTADRNVTIMRVTSTNNARDGMSLIQVRDIQVLNSNFNENGRTEGEYGGHSPSSGIDVEPNQIPPNVDVETGGVEFRDCQFADNTGLQFVSILTNAVEQIDLRHCTFRAQKPDDYHIAFQIFPANGSVQDCTFDLSFPHLVYLHGLVRSSYPQFRQLVFAHNVFNLGSNEGIISDPPEPLNILFQGNSVNVVGPPGDRTYVKLRGMALVAGNTFFVDGRGYSGGATQPVVLYDGTRRIEGNVYRTNLSGPGRAFKINYPAAAQVANERYSSNFSR